MKINDLTSGASGAWRFCAQLAASPPSSRRSGRRGGIGGGTTGLKLICVLGTLTCGEIGTCPKSFDPARSVAEFAKMQFC